MRSKYKIYNHEGTIFLTSSIVNWVNLFNSEIYISILADAIKYNQEKRNLEIFAYVIMKNHFHLLCRADKLSKIMSSIKSYSAKKIIEYLKFENRNDILNVFRENKLPYKHDRYYQLWQEGFHPKAIAGDEMYNQKLNYIHNNPVKAGYVDNAIDWKYSSARFYHLDEEGIIKITVFD